MKILPATDGSEYSETASEILDSDITALGCRGLRGIKGMLGSVSRYIVTHSHCSVLVGKI